MKQKAGSTCMVYVCSARFCIQYGNILFLVYNNVSGISTSSTMATTSMGYPAPLGHVKGGTGVLRNSPLSISGDAYSNSSGQASRSVSPSSDDSDKWHSYLRAKDELIGQKDQIIDR